MLPNIKLNSNISLGLPVLLSYKRKPMDASRDQVKLAAKFNTKHDEGSCLDVFKRRKYYFKLYVDRLEAFNTTESSIGAPKFTIHPGEGTFIEKLKSPPLSIKVHSKDVKIIIETKSDEMQSEWLKFLTEVFKEKAACTHGLPSSEAAEDNIAQTKVNLSKEIAVRFQKTNPNFENSCEPNIILPATAIKSDFILTKSQLNSSTSKTAPFKEKTVQNAVHQSNCSTVSSKFITLPGAKLKINPAFSPFPFCTKILQPNQERNQLITNSNGKGPSSETNHSNSSPMTSLPLINPRGPMPTIIPSDDLYDEPEEYDSLEVQAVQNIPTAPKVKENNCLEIIPVKLSRVLYGSHGWPLILKFKDGKISLIKEESGAVIVNWEFRHIRKFKCKADLFFFETGHKYPGGSKLFEFQLVEKVSQKSINEISDMIHQEMKSVSSDGSKKIQNKKSEDTDIRSRTFERISSTPPNNFRNSNLFQNDVMHTPAVPPPFTSKAKTEFKRADVIIIPSDDLYDELVDYVGLEEDTTEQHTKPLIPINQPQHDGINYEGEEQYVYLWEQAPPSSPQYPEVKKSVSTMKDKPEEGASSSDVPSDLQRYKGPIDDSLYALPSQS